MRTLKLTLAYDGTDFVGWQRQAHGTSVQGLLEAALESFEGRPVSVHGAGRTDAGVHALGQVASVSLRTTQPAEAIRRGLNAALPREIRVVAAEDAAPAFHARFHAVAKVYEYRLINAPIASPFVARYSWHVPQPLELTLLRSAADILVGRHDFAAFQGSGSRIRSTVRTVQSITCAVGPTPDVPLVITVRADGFLRHMVRTMVGTLIDAGLRRTEPHRIAEILAGRDRRRAGPTAPPQGLFLKQVEY